jgi:carbon storage regulator CsrA
VLVLSRKVGEQVVLPDCGVTVEVVAVSGKRVRLGFAAPSGTRVHRTEVWHRICGANGNGCKGEGLTLGEDRLDACPTGEDDDRRETGAEPVRQPPLPGTGGDEPCSPQCACGNLDASLARWIARRTGGRIHSLLVKSLDGRLLVSGSTGSYYARQLAQAAVNEMLGALGGALRREVEISIDVAGTEIGRGGSALDH